jgi:hypothetical protein
MSTLSPGCTQPSSRSWFLSTSGKATNVPVGPRQPDVARASSSSRGSFLLGSDLIFTQGKFVFSVMFEAGALPTFRRRITHRLTWPSSKEESSLETFGEAPWGYFLTISAVKHGISFSIVDLSVIDSPRAKYEM